LYIPYDAFAPNAVGDIPPVELLIWTKAGGPPTHIPLPADIMRSIWRDHLRWRGARLALRDRAAAAEAAGTHRALVPVPVPADTALRTAIRFEQQHRDADAARITLERLVDPTLRPNDRRIALMSLASTFQADDDAPAAAMLANELTAMDPCALSGTSDVGGAPVGNETYGGMRAAGGLLDGLRPEARCTPLPHWVTLVRGTLLPGYGQYRSWSRAVGIATGALTLSGAITAYKFLSDANSSYAKYHVTQTGFAPYLRTAAKNDRRNARTLATAAGALWVASAIEGELHERIVGARLRAEHDFWFKPIVGTADGAGSAAFSAGLSLTFR
jgi:hypothetical protein